RPRLAHERKVVGGPEKARDQHRDRPGPDRAEERVHVLGTVGEDDEDALLLLDAEPPESGGQLVDALAELAAAHVEVLRLRARAASDGRHWSRRRVNSSSVSSWPAGSKKCPANIPCPRWKRRDGSTSSAPVPTSRLFQRPSAFWQSST